MKRWFQRRDVDWQVPHHAIGWLLLGAVWAVMPTLLRGPTSLLVLTLALLAWRWRLVRGRLTMPPLPVRIGLLLLVVLLTLWHFHTIFGPAAGVALLTTAFVLKTLEMFRLRDAYVVLLLGYFVLAMVFLFQKGIFITLYVAAGMLLLSAALIGINRSHGNASPWQHLRLALVMLLQALPVMLVIFVLVPRVAPLWSFGLDTRQAKTGLAGSMSPGSISDLSRSSEPVFRVEFDGPVPPPAKRYWRGLTYSVFDGETWRQAPEARRERLTYYPGEPRPGWYRRIKIALRDREADYRYRVLMEPSGRRWLFALDVPQVSDNDIGMVRDYRLIHREDIDQPIAYRVASYTGVPKDLQLPARLRQLNLALPSEVDPRTRALAQGWYAMSPSDEAFIQRVLDWFHQQPFYYTLQPPPLETADAIDEFMFETRRGFCAHYASAFTFMMRSVGIPARIVAGYQGGEINPLGQYLQVRQYNAHAWVEVWLDGQGWVREDPTAAVAPSRIETGLLAALSEEDQASIYGSLVPNWKGLGWLTQLSLMSDYLNYLWQRWVLSYDRDNQQALFDDWFGDGRWLYWLLGGGVALLLVAALVLRWLARQQQRQLTAWQKEYLRLYGSLEKRGLEVAPSLPPGELIARAVKRWPDRQAALEGWLAIYQQLAYAAPSGDRKQQLQQLRRAWPL